MKMLLYSIAYTYYLDRGESWQIEYKPDLKFLLIKQISDVNGSEPKADEYGYSLSDNEIFSETLAKIVLSGIITEYKKQKA